MTEKFTVSFSPHIRGSATTSRIMLDVIIAMFPAFAVSVLFFGPRAALVTAVCVAACLFFEWVFQKFVKKPVTIMDFSAVITGLLLAFNLPVTIPLWQAVVGCFVAIVLVKQIFGGLGKNFANPAVTARVVMLLAFSGTMTDWSMPMATPAWVMITDAVASPTPLAVIAGNIEAGISLQAANQNLPNLWHMFLGLRGGSFGETSAIALLIGGIYLMIRKVITWHIPLTFIATVAALMFIAGGFDATFMLYHVLAGGLFIGAFFMATDYVTSPQTPKGRIIFGIGCGLITVVIRVFGNLPEGVSFAILLMNALVPFISRYTLTKPLGGKKA